jgi:integrase/predicted RNA-binding Zn-ribbon protein involved in translation (DUF1610 family)
VQDYTNLSENQASPVGPQPNVTTYIPEKALDALGKVSLKCPECHSRKIYRNGFRKQGQGLVQRFLCQECGYRFSPSNVGKALNSKYRIELNCQVCVTRGSKNLDSAAEIKAVADGIRLLGDNPALKGKLLEFEFWMQKQGYKLPTIRGRVVRVAQLAAKGANLYDPETVKAVIALQQTWSDGTKANVVDAYSTFLTKEGLTWKPPRYKREETIPFIPSEAELNLLIGAAGRKLGIFLQGLKETGADPGELAGIEAKDVNKESRTITLNHPVKGHRPRILPVSVDLINRLETVMKNDGRTFNADQLRRAFFLKRKASARKLSNPRLKEITFITFRHWVGTMEYHRTKDILHVQRLLGHKSIQNTLIYIDLETKLFNGPSNEGFTSRIAHNVGEAAALVEVGFEFVTGEYSDGGKIFRKRK